MSEPSPYFQQYADWLKWRAGRFTAGPPQLLSQYGIQLEDWRLKPIATLYGLAEITGIPTLIRWGQAIIQNRPISEVEKEYFGRISRELQEAGIGVSEEALRRRVEQATMHAALTALPLAVPLSKQEAAMLAKSLGVGFGFVGGPTAIIRAEQGYKDEALKAFVEAGLAGTVLTDVAMALKGLAAAATPERLAAIRRQVMQERRGAAGMSDPEFNAFMKEIEDALLALRRGDASKYDNLVRQFEEWRGKVEEFQRLYEARQRGPLSPEDEARYTNLLKEVAQIRDRYELLKQYIEAARMAGLEAGARRAELESRTISDLARAVQEAPPGPPRRDLTEWLQRVELDFLQKLVKDRNMLAKYARRFGVDEQTLTERVMLLLRERQWENVANMPSSELKKILMDDTQLKKYASELNVAEDKLRAFIEDVLQGRMGAKAPASEKPRPQLPPASEKPEPAKPPIERIEPVKERQPPEAEVVGRGGQVLVVKAEEELRPSVRRLEELPTVEARLRYLLTRARVKPELQRLREAELQQLREKPEPRDRGGARREEGADTARTADEAPGRTADVTPGRTTDRPTKTADDAPGRTADKTDDVPGRTTDRMREVVEREVLVLDRDALRTLVPALPAYVFTLPAPIVLAMISRAVGVPIALAPGLPRPSPREPFGGWLDRVFAGSGFAWRALAAQKETFVFA